MRSKLLRDVRAAVAEAGLVVVSITDTRGNHGRLEVRRGDGETRTLFFPGSPSDHRGEKNLRADLRRFARQDLIH